MANKKGIKSALESMLFVWGEPLDVKTAAEACNINWKDALDYFRELMEEYEWEGRGIRIREINQAFQFVTLDTNADYIERLCTPVKQAKLSQSALEVLAIIAYKQPVTKGEIEAIRGIKCDRVIEGLSKKDLVGEVGRSPGIGRPVLYGTTNEFLRHFGLTTIKDLPEIDDIADAIAQDDMGMGDVLEGQVALDQMGLDF